MQIEKNTVVTFNYVVRSTESGQTLDSSNERNEPLHVLIGSESIVEGLENALVGHAVGDKFTVAVPAGEAYGNHADELIQSAPKDAFGDADISVGARFTATTEDGEEVSVVITHIDHDHVTVDGNHPLAGVDLTFDVDILSVRAATDTELEIEQAIDDE